MVSLNCPCFCLCCLTSSVINLVGQGLWFIFFAQCVKATDCKWDNCFFTVVQNLNVWGRTKPCWSIPLKSLFPRTLGGTLQVNKFYLRNASSYVQELISLRPVQLLTPALLGLMRVFPVSLVSFGAGPVLLLSGFGKWEVIWFNLHHQKARAGKTSCLVCFHTSSWTLNKHYWKCESW